ncbi:MAG: hypothetical protein NZ551_12365 [Microscillaceae bacterium]|nr:hypothetical protein [Microscillaceae bacterium]MDW8461987.1 hypothetical protein [Cytophagales bacterium]
MKALVFLVAGLLIFTGQTTFAQRSKTKAKTQKPSKEEAKRKKEEDKRTKNELRNYSKNPEAFRRFQQSKENAERQRDSLLTELGRVSQLEQQCEREVENLRADYEALLRKCKGFEEKIKTISEMPPPAPSPCQSIPKEGTFYSVQIGAFKQIDLDKQVNEKKVEMKKESEDGFDKYIVSYFDSYAKAEAFKKHLMYMGLRQVWIVAYKDGKRVDIKTLK